MLKQRILTALVLIPLVVAGVLGLPTVWVALILLLLVLLGAEEWAKLSGLATCGTHVAFLSGVAGTLVLVAWAYREGLDLAPLFLLACLWWVWVGRRVMRIREVRPVAGPDPLAVGQGFLVLVPMWAALVWLHQIHQGPYLTLFLLVLIWVADSGAFFAGRRFGRVKLAPVVSPGKTREGLYGALAGGLLWSIPLVALYGTGVAQGLGLLLLCLLTVLASVVGDLFESLAKRQRGVKDSGSLLPGHGGVLDRIDSLTAAAPVFALGIYLLGGAA